MVLSYFSHKFKEKENPHLENSFFLKKNAPRPDTATNVQQKR
jgi:hypothetical protein